MADGSAGWTTAVDGIDGLEGVAGMDMAAGDHTPPLLSST
jgi:hypothetical protein